MNDKMEFLLSCLDLHIGAGRTPIEAIDLTIKDYVQVYHIQESEMSNKTPDELPDAHRKLIDAIDAVKAIKPEERSSKARYCAIVITELEKALALYMIYIKDAK